MAVLIDRAPADPEWKGGVAWAIVNALAESQHDVQVFTPLDPAALPTPHPRVNVARPASSFHVKTTLDWARALAQLQPHVVHTFAPVPTARLGALTAWPYLGGLAAALPRTARVATVFDDADLRSDRPGARWVRGHARWTTFDDHMGGAGERTVLTLGDVVPAAPADDPTGEVLIPAPVAEWRDGTKTFGELAHFLAADSARRVRIVGGWGDVPLAERRRAWEFLADFGARVRLGPPRSLEEYARDRRAASGTWTRPLAPRSFRALVDAALDPGDGASGRTVNALSRIYSTPGRW